MIEEPKEVEQEEPPRPWAEVERVRPPWQLQKHGEFILPQNSQKSNNDLTDDQVLQPRDEPVIISTAKPISGRKGTGGGTSDEPSGKKANLPSNFSRIT